MENKLLQAMKTKDSLTDNGAVTNSTSLNSVLDLFFIAGASRKMSEDVIFNMITKAWKENSNLTLRLIFWAGDVRQGAGERRFFRIALKWLSKYNPKALINNIEFVPVFNRWDSLFDLVCEDTGIISTKILDFISFSLFKEKNGLLAKWMPRKKQYNNLASKFRKFNKMDPKRYRQLIVSLSKTVEQNMCDNKWNIIEYRSVPSVAFSKYRKAFKKNDCERFSQFLSNVEKGIDKINAKAIFPHDIYRSFSRGGDDKSIDLQWKALPNYLENSSERFLPVCDVSGSMTGTPMEISVSLGIYLSERNNSAFKDAFITFSEIPSLEYLKGSLTQRMRQLGDADWGANTNLQGVFELVLNKAIESNISESDMPTSLIIISDMEFDMAISDNSSNFEEIKEKYKKSGYKLPKIIFWNVNGRAGNVPVNINDKNVALISGASPSIVKSVLSGEISPVSSMMKTLLVERYDCLK